MKNPSLLSSQFRTVDNANPDLKNATTKRPNVGTAKKCISWPHDWENQSQISWSVSSQDRHCKFPKSFKKFSSKNPSMIRSDIFLVISLQNLPKILAKNFPSEILRAKFQGICRENPTEYLSKNLFIWIIIWKFLQKILFRFVLRFIRDFFQEFL